MENTAYQKGKAPAGKLRAQRGPEHEVGSTTPYRIACIVILIIIAILFTFPLYWIITGSFKTNQVNTARVPQWFPLAPTIENYQNLFTRPAMKWLGNTVVMCVSSMALTCVAGSMAGYALAKKKFHGRALFFSLFVGAMALPKQVILIPLLKEMSFLGIHNTLWAVIMPTVGWPFGVFLMKQFSESIPDALLEAAKIDGAGETRTFVEIVLPLISPGIGALAIFTFISCWNDYFLQLIMLNETAKLSISLGIAKMQGQFSNDFGLIMAGAALSSVPIIIVFIMFQRFFTSGITMGAVKG